MRSPEHPIDADDGRFDTGKSPRNINKRPISPSAAKVIFQRLHWKTIDNNIRCNISCIDDVKMLVDEVVGALLTPRWPAQVHPT